MRCQRRIVTDEHQAALVTRALLQQQADKGIPCIGIQCRGRLIGDDQLGRTDKRPCRSYALLLSDTQFIHGTTSQRRGVQPQGSQQMLSFGTRRMPCTGLPGTTRGETATKQYVVDQAEIRQQIELLKNIADVIGTKAIAPGRPQRRKRSPQRVHAALDRCQHTGQQAQQGALAAAAGAADEYTLTTRHFKIGQVQHVALPAPGKTQATTCQQWIGDTAAHGMRSTRCCPACKIC